MGSKGNEAGSRAVTNPAGSAALAVHHREGKGVGMRRWYWAWVVTPDETNSFLGRRFLCINGHLHETVAEALECRADDRHCRWVKAQTAMVRAWERPDAE